MREELALPQLEHGSVVTVGAFDGVHIGHRAILRQLTARASSVGLPAVLLTFSSHPLEVVNPEAAPLLLTPGVEKLDALVDSGPMFVVVLPFTPALARLSAEEFVRELLIDRYRMRDLVVGYDHGLGAGRRGDAALLTSLGKSMGFGVEVVPPTVGGPGEVFSSRTIRSAIAAGDLDSAERGLGRRYSLRGTVVPGHQRGRDLGYPTLNIELAHPRKLLPPEGVYAVRAQTSRGEFGGMMNLGPRPTFAELSRTLEVHLFDVSGDWYGEAVSVAFFRRLRNTVRFESVDALVAQLGRDAEDARFALTQA